jgi:hypothetical protein
MKLGCCFSFLSFRNLRSTAHLFSYLGCALFVSLTASLGAAELTLTWDDNSSDETGFKIERALNGSTSFTQVATVAPNVTSYVDSGLSAGTQYSYRVRAYNEAGDSAYSNIVNYTTATINTAPTISALADHTISANTSTAALAFNISDAETVAASLTLSSSSSNTELVPTANIVFGGTGSSRTVTVSPAANQTGVATITIKVSDGSLSATSTFTVTVKAAASVNTAPTITSIADQTLTTNGSTAALAFTISDAETAASSLTVSASSSNATLLPTANIVFGGSGTSRTVTVSPAANQTGTATITVKVSDGALTASTTFTVTVNAPSPSNTAPSITSIADQTINVNGATAALSFKVSDNETGASGLTVTGSSSNTSLVPLSGIVIATKGANRTVTVTPAAGKSGSATITMTVSDGSLTASTAFKVTVNAVSGGNTSPTISEIADQTVAANSSTSAIPFTVGDAETAAVSLTLTGSSSDTTIVPTHGINFGGSGGNRTLTITPAAGKSGSATITITVSDGSLSSKAVFAVTVGSSTGAPSNTAPTITKISDQTISTNSSTSSLGFRIDDSETAAASLTVSGASSNTTLVPANGISFGGSGSTRTVSITPAKNQTGTATIMLSVSDGVLSTTSSFEISVIASTGAPQFTAHPQSQTTKLGASLTLTAVATGTPAPSYQWRKDGVVISGATGATLTIADVQVEAAGFYDVVATNNKGSATSNAAVVATELPNYAGTYFGSFSGGGTWALYVRDNLTATYIASLPSRNLTLVLELVVEADGSLVLLSTQVNSLATAAEGSSALAVGSTGSVDRYSTKKLKLSGKIKDGTVLGEFSDFGINFNGLLDAAGPTQNLAGLHTATTGSASLYSIVGSSGRTVTVITTATQIDAATGTTQPNGSFSVTTAAGGQVVSKTDTSKLTFTATYVPADTSTTVQLTGRAEHAPSASKLVNVSIRTKAGSGSETLITGFVVKGAQKSVLVRAIGPTLSNYGVSGVLNDPTLSVYSGQTMTMSNDDWASQGATQITAANQRVGAFPLLNGSRDAAVFTQFGNGGYSAHVSGKNGATGVTLLELYDADTQSDSRLINVSARSFVGTGDDVQIVGFYIAGEGPRQVLIRAVGPSLSTYGVTGALANPYLRLYRGSTKIQENDDWGGTTALASAFSSTGAFQLHAGSKDAAILVTLEPGAYSAIVAGVDGGTGVALLELYEIQ